MQKTNYFYLDFIYLQNKFHDFLASRLARKGSDVTVICNFDAKLSIRIITPCLSDATFLIDALTFKEILVPVNQTQCTPMLINAH